MKTRDCYAVIFSSTQSSDTEGYDATAQRMNELAAQQPGYLGIESTRGANGFGITVSYWESLEAIRAWKANTEHLVAQKTGVSAGMRATICVSAASSTSTASRPQEIRHEPRGASAESRGFFRRGSG